MIGSLRGKLIGMEGLSALIEVNGGIGYEVEIPGNLLSSLKMNEECFLYIHHVVREDADLLYGFDSQESRLFFRELIKINGIGPRAAIALLSTMDLPTFIEVINAQRINALMAAPGIGKKTAERIIVEMKDRLNKLRIGERIIVQSANAINAELGVEMPQNTVDENAFAFDDAIQALMSLGYKENIAIATVKAVFEKGMTTEQIIVASLAKLSKS